MDYENAIAGDAARWEAEDIMRLSCWLVPLEYYGISSSGMNRRRERNAKLEEKKKKEEKKVDQLDVYSFYYY